MLLGEELGNNQGKPLGQLVDDLISFDPEQFKRDPCRLFDAPSVGEWPLGKAELGTREDV